MSLYPFFTVWYIEDEVISTCLELNIYFPTVSTKYISHDFKFSFHVMFFA